MGRGALAGVAVSTADIGIENLDREHIVLFGADGNQEWYGIGNIARRETFDVPGAISVLRVGKSEAVIREARARAYEIYAEVERQLYETPTLGDAKVAQIGATDLRQLVAANGQIARVFFVIRVQAYLEVNI